MDKDDFKLKILEVASEVFKRFGYKKTTMDEIAKQLGKGKSSIYYYYKSKEDIFQSVVEEEANLLQEEVKKSIDITSDPKEQIKNYVLTRMKAYKRVINFNNALKDNVLLHLDFVVNIRNNFDAYEIELVKNILSQGAESGEFEIQNPDFAAIGIVTALKGLEVPLFKEADDSSLEEKLDKLLRLLFYGIIRR